MGDQVALLESQYARLTAIQISLNDPTKYLY